MNRNRGFSLTEILVSLLLIASISLALLKQQWQLNRLLQQIIQRVEARIQLDNQQELVAGEKLNFISKYICRRPALYARDPCTKRDRWISRRSRGTSTLSRHQFRASDESQRGFNLVELGICLFLMSCLLSFLMQHYQQVKRQYVFVRSSIEQMIDFQLLTETMQMSIRKAGFTPCLSIQSLKTIDKRTEKEPLKALVVNESALQVNRMDDHFFSVSNLSNQELWLSTRPNFQPHDVIMIADCYHAEVQTVVASEHHADTAWVRLSQPLHFKYHAPIYVGFWLEETYFMMKHPHAPDSLGYKLHHTEELSPDVLAMTVRAYPYLAHQMVSVSLTLRDQKARTLLTRTRMI